MELVVIGANGVAERKGGDEQRGSATRRATRMDATGLRRAGSMTCSGCAEQWFQVYFFSIPIVVVIGSSTHMRHACIGGSL